LAEKTQDEIIQPVRAEKAFTIFYSGRGRQENPVPVATLQKGKSYRVLIHAGKKRPARNQPAKKDCGAPDGKHSDH
jgi:hypothetical protein